MSEIELVPARPVVLLESPFSGKTPGELARNIQYARLAIRDCISRGEAPFASHLLYTQDHILLDTIPEERQLGIACGLAFQYIAASVVVYTNLGITEGMQQGISHAEKLQLPILYRTLPTWRGRQGDAVLDPLEQSPYSQISLPRE